MEHNECRECQYFVQHYALNPEGRLVKVYWGHCIKARPKMKRPDRKNCEEFVPREQDGQEYATKQYLTVVLLRRILDMELLPEDLQE